MLHPELTQINHSVPTAVGDVAIAEEGMALVVDKELPDGSGVTVKPSGNATGQRFYGVSMFERRPPMKMVDVFEFTLPATLVNDDAVAELPYVPDPAGTTGVAMYQNGEDLGHVDAVSSSVENYISNLETATASAVPFVANRSLSQPFVTGSDSGGYPLAEVILNLEAIGSGAIEVTIRKNVVVGSNDSGDTIYTLTNPATLVVGENTFTAPAGATLDPDTTYYIVAISTSGTTTSWRRFSIAATIDNIGGWDIDHEYLLKTGAGQWAGAGNFRLTAAVRGNPSTDAIGIIVDGKIIKLSTDNTDRFLGHGGIDNSSSTTVAENAVTAGATIRVQYSYAPSLGQQAALVGTNINLTSVNGGAQVTCIRKGIIYTTNYDVKVPYAIGWQVGIGADGKFTRSGASSDDTNLATDVATVIHVPSVDNPFLGLELF